MLLFGSDALDALEPLFSFTEEQLEALLCKLGANYTRRQGENVQADHCFIHHNSSPTLGISVEPPHKYNCFNPACSGRGPDAIALVAMALKTDRPSAIAWIYTNFPSIERVKGQIGITIVGNPEEEKPFVLPESTLAAFDPHEDNEIGFRAVAYYQNQHGDPLCFPNQVDEFKIGYDRLNHRLIFPVFHKDGTLAGMIGRAMLPNVSSANRWMNYEKEKFKRARCLVGIEQPFEKGPLVVVEGPSDYFYLRSRGVKNVVATMGAEFSPWQVETMLQIGKDIVPLFDLDEAGIEARKKFHKAINGRCRLLPSRYPKSAFDAKGKADPRNIASSDIESLVASFGKIQIGKFT